MRVIKLIIIVLLIYAGIVAAFETMIGITQPQAGEVLVITTTDADGNAGDRVLVHLTSGGKIYVAANHWPRAWYENALATPEVEVTIEGQTLAYTAVPVSGAEHAQLETDNPLTAPFRFITGYPPRYFLRLDPR